MTTKAKTFDCVAMKRKIQADMLAEYAAAKDQYKSFAAFIEAQSNKSRWIREARERLETLPRQRP